MAAPPPGGPDPIDLAEITRVEADRRRRVPVQVRVTATATPIVPGSADQLARVAVVRSITTRHQGHVHATTSPLGGTRIAVTLPTIAPDDLV